MGALKLLTNDSEREGLLPHTLPSAVANFFFFFLPIFFDPGQIHGREMVVLLICISLKSVRLRSHCGS